jgi:hypothetical protein
VKNNNYEPTYAFDIAAFSKDSANTVIDVTKFYGSVKAIYWIIGQYERGL